MALSLAACVVGFYASAASAEIQIAVAGPITGQYAALGEQIRQGAEAAAKAINAKGGVLGEQVKVVVEDDVGDPKQGVSVANRIVGNGIKFVIGHFNSGVSIPASEVYAENNVVMVTPGSTNPLLTSRGLQDVFRVCGRDDQTASVAARYMVAHFKNSKIAIIDDKTQPAIGLADGVESELKKADITPVMRDSINPGEKDFSVFLGKLKAANVDLLYYTGGDPEAGLIARQAHESGQKLQLFSTDGIATSEFPAIAGPASEGAVFVFGLDARQSSSAQAVVAEMRAQGIEPEGFTLYGYAAMQVIAQGMEKSQKADPQGVIDALHDTANTFHTVLGPRSYDKNGDITQDDFAVYVWKGNKYIVAK
ncbi:MULTISPECIES: branched-chain amino acid ABC transporter substrate-binding protein [unclassified Mesorhizobium]|uniref:branched-chain amino acid ABC transporter substrate-binding protein n=1 Tax=unclassified Mesorhizobium TaxID=325217 RepID=UPI001FEEBA39|nr:MULTISPECIES: branched-chain amino acid ABC transporter substrate-binding protein [unclassified Mesorhizobium]